MNKITFLIETMLVYCYQKLLKRFTIVRCRICFNDTGRVDICYYPVSHTRKNTGMVICNKCQVQYLSFVYDPCPSCKNQIGQGTVDKIC